MAVRFGPVSTETDIWRAIERSNAAWTSGDPEGVAPLFAEDVVLVAPGLNGAVVGRRAMVQSYVDFTAVADTKAFEPLERRIDVSGDTAVASYTYRVRYELDGQTHDEQGQEILVLRRGEDGWKAIWRTQVPG